MHHFAAIHITLSPAAFGRWYQGLGQPPFRVRQIAGVSQLIAVVSASVLARPHRWRLLTRRPYPTQLLLIIPKLYGRTLKAERPIGNACPG